MGVCWKSALSTILISTVSRSIAPNAINDACPGVEHRDVSSLTAAEFRANFVEAKRPLMLRGAFEAWPATIRNRQFLPDLLQHAGNLNMAMFSRPGSALRPQTPSFEWPLASIMNRNDSTWLHGPELFAYQIVSGAMKEVVTTVLGDDAFFDDLGNNVSETVGIFHEPDMDWTLSIGVEGSGEGLQRTDDAWFALLPADGDQSSENTKVWYWYESIQEVPDEHIQGVHAHASFDRTDAWILAAETSAAVHRREKQNRLKRCIQHPREVLFLPGGFYFTTLNRGRGPLVVLGAQAASNGSSEDACEGTAFCDAEAVTRHIEKRMAPDNAFLEKVWNILSVQPFYLHGFLPSLAESLAAAGYDKDAKDIVSRVLEAAQSESTSVTLCHHVRAATLIAVSDVKYLNWNDTDGARILLEEAAGISNTSRAFETLAAIHAKLGKWKRTSEIVAKFVQVFPHSKRANMMAQAVKRQLAAAEEDDDEL